MSRVYAWYAPSLVCVGDFGVTKDVLFVCLSVYYSHAVSLSVCQSGCLSVCLFFLFCVCVCLIIKVVSIFLLVVCCLFSHIMNHNFCLFHPDVLSTSTWRMIASK